MRYLYRTRDSLARPTPDPSQAIADSYENSVLFYEHTWGGSMGWITNYLPPKNNLGQCGNWSYREKWRAELKTKRFDRLIASWEEHTDYARNAGKLVAAPTKYRAIARHISAACPTGGGLNSANLTCHRHPRFPTAP